MNYYNEFDPFAAAWLRELIKASEIPPGEVDERSIEDIAPAELSRFVQCHFFAGIGGWPLALRQAGVPADRPLWTGSCPCQPFSAAGKGKGFADERHLWPAFDWLIGQSRPDIVLGEQVEGPAGRAWLDLVATDLEGHGYAFGTAVFPAAGVGAPQIRHRTYWVADSMRAGRAAASQCQPHGQAGGWQQGDGGASFDCEAGGVADAGRQRRQQVGQGASGDEAAHGRARRDGGQPDGGHLAAGDGATGGLADAAGEQEHEEQRRPATNERGGNADLSGGRCMADPRAPTGPVNGFWRASDWLYCRDDKWRPVEPGTFPLVARIPGGLGRDSANQESEAKIQKAQGSRVGRLRGYGNAVCVPQAVAFIEAVLAA